MKQKQIFFAIEIVIVLLISLNFTSALTIKSVTTFPSEIAPGEKASITLDIKNNLKDNVENVRISLDLSKAPLAPEKSSADYIDEINEDDSEKASFDLIAFPDAAGGIYQIPVLITYNLNDENKTENLVISITINSKPNFILSQENTLIKNQKNKASIRITNTGLTKSKFLEIELGSGSYDILSANKVYIGDLDSNDFDTADFQVFLKDSSMVSFPITLRYRDSANNQFTETQAVIAKVYSQKEAVSLGLIQKSNTLTYVISIIILVALYFIYRAIRKRRRNKLKAGE